MQDNIQSAAEETIDKQKEKQFEKELRARHSRPLLKLYKMMSTEQFQADYSAQGQHKELHAHVQFINKTIDEYVK